MRLVLCDENRIMCEALAAAMEAWGHQVVAITTTAEQGIAAVGVHQPDAVVLEPRVPAGNGSAGAKAADATRAWTDCGGASQTGKLGVAEVMRARYPGTPVLVLSSFVNRATWSAAMKMGVAGYLCKDRSHVSLPPVSRRREGPHYQLTPREKEVLRRLVAGQGTRQMAHEMSVTIDTLRGYVKNVLGKLGAHSRLQAAALAAREDLLAELKA